MGGGGFLGDVVKAVTNPVGTVSDRVFGSNSPITRAANMNVGALAGRALTGGTPKPGGGDSRVSAQPFEGMQYDERGRPILRNFDSQLGSDGMISSQYQLQPTLDRRALESVRTEALRGPGELSRYSQMALTQGQNQNASQVAGQTSQAMNNLAMQGGLRTGARERLAQSGMRQNLLGNQSVLQNVQMQDELNRQKYLNMLPGMELQTAQYDNALQDKNINRSLTELNQGRDFDKFRYGQAMQAYGADKSSEAMRRSAEEAKSTSGLFGGGGFLGLGF